MDDDRVKLWLDDLRPAPPGWVECRSVAQAKVFLRGGAVEWASLDHDLGDQILDGGTARQLIMWLEEEKLWPSEGTRVHSSSQSATDCMLAAMDAAQAYSAGGSDYRGSSPDGGWPPRPNV